jgi:hypothetical protein
MVVARMTARAAAMEETRAIMAVKVRVTTRGGKGQKDDLELLLLAVGVV